MALANRFALPERRLDYYALQCPPTHSDPLRREDCLSPTQCRGGGQCARNSVKSVSVIGGGLMCEKCNEVFLGTTQGLAGHVCESLPKIDPSAGSWWPRDEDVDEDNEPVERVR